MKRILYKFLSEIILIIFCGVLVFLWFRDSKLLISGEEIFSIVDPIKTLKTHLYPWFYLTEPGLPTTRFYLPRVTFFAFAALFYQIGFPSWLIQAISYFILAFLGTTGVSLLIKYFFKKKGFLAPFAGGLFYFLNLYSLTQVWGRFIYSAIFAWALLPLSLIFFSRWLVGGQLRWLLFFLVISTFLSHAFGNPGYSLAIWVPLVLMAIVSILKAAKRKNNFIVYSYRCSIFIFSWSLINAWWIYPYLVNASSLFSEISGSESNFDSLRGVSQYFPLTSVLLLRQEFLLGPTSPWFVSYSKRWVILVSLSVILVVLIGWIKSKKEKFWLFFSLLSFIGLFVSKGSNLPFGYIFYDLLFRIIRWVAGSLRNPYEKFGLVWLLPYSIFFALGINFVYQKLKPKIREIVVGGILFLSCGVLVWPMWTGSFINGNQIHSKVDIPQYYKDANAYLENSEVSRIFEVPYLLGDAVKYSWGFQGLQPSEFLFNSPSIAKVLRAKYFDYYYLTLKDYLNNSEFVRLIGLVGVNRVILHRDMDLSIYAPYIDGRKEIFDWKGISFDRKIGNLEIYKVDDKLILDEVYVVNNLIPVTTLNEGFELILEGVLNPKYDSFLFKNSGLKKIDVNKGRLPSITFKKIKPGRYRVDVRFADNPFILVLNETYDKKWQLKDGGKIIDTHFVVNGFQNGWLIEKFGNYTLDLVYKIWPWE